MNNQLQRNDRFKGLFMKVRRSLRVILVSTLVLVIFSSLIIWHDKPVQPSLKQTVAIDSLIQRNSQLKSFLDQINTQEDACGFYSVGLKTEQSWPIRISSACYPDPLAGRWQFAGIQSAYSHTIKVIRYRSKTDFCLMLLKRTGENPEYISTLKLNSHMLVIENPLAISLRLLVAIIVGGVGLMFIRWVNSL